MEHHPSTHVLLFWSFFLGPQQICYSETNSQEGKLVLSIVPITFKRKEFLNSSNSSGVNVILVPAFLIGVPLRNAASVSAEKLTHEVTQEVAC